jgi:gliding motility-associated-like protein
MTYLRTIIVLILCLPLVLFGQIKQIDMGPTSYVLCSDSTVTCYGIDPMVTTRYSEKPTKLTGLGKVLMVTTGLYDGYFLFEDSTVWGIDIQKMEFPYNISFFKMPDLKKIVKITSEKFGHTAIDVNGDVWVWGIDKVTRLRSTETYKLNVHNVSEASYYNGGIVLKLDDGTVWQNYPGCADTSLKKVTNIVNPIHVYSDEYAQFGEHETRNFAIDSNNCLLKWVNYDDVPISIDCNVKEAKLGYYGCFYLKSDGTVWRIKYLNSGYVTSQYQFPQKIKNIFVEDDLLGAISEEGSIWQGKIDTDTIYQRGDKNEKFWTCADCVGQLVDTTIQMLDTTINSNINIVLNAGNPGKNYIWFPSTGLNNNQIQNPTANISENTEYIVTISDSIKCTFREKFTFQIRDCDTIISKYLKTVLDTVIIPDTEITLKATGFDPYIWNPNTGITNVSGNEFTLTSSENSIYNLSQNDSYNCVYSQDYKIGIRNCDTIITDQYFLKLDTIVQKGTQLEIHPSASYSSYEWLPNPNLNCTDCNFPILNVQGNEVIYVNLFNSWNCPYTEIFTVKTDETIPEIQIPDIFTPNGDGINDVFEIGNKPDQVSIQIFNKYNLLVYSSDNYQNDWNGLNNNGQALEEDNFWYIIKLTNSDIAYKGSVFIKR